MVGAASHQCGKPGRGNGRRGGHAGVVDGLAGVLISSAIAVAALMLTTWIVSLVVSDASIVDLIWGLGFVLVAWTAVIVGDGYDARALLLAALVTVWGLRLSGYLAWRNLGSGEDKRYQAMRERWGARFWLVSLVTVFVLQGVLMWIVSLPVQLSASAADPSNLGLLAWLGVAVWLVGFGFESLGDLQLARFKADPDNAREVMDRGLWRYTRHPNYFGDFCVWWGIFLVAAETGPGRWGVIGPIVMSALLMRYSGVGVLEKSIGSRRPGYAEYARRTSTFFPRPPKPAGGEEA
jgi:steroid 5-alpha reductase family enzyme